MEVVRLTGNATTSGCTVATTLVRETALLSDKFYGRTLEDLGIRTIRYSNAVVHKRRMLVELISRLSGK
jgi:hypothetical protein